MLDDNLKIQLKTYLERLTRPVELVASLDGSDASRELQALQVGFQLDFEVVVKHGGFLWGG